MWEWLERLSVSLSVCHASVCLTEKKIYLLNHAVSVLDSLLIADDAAVQLALCRPKDENIFFREIAVRGTGANRVPTKYRQAQGALIPHHLIKGMDREPLTSPYSLVLILLAIIRYKFIRYYHKTS